MKLKFGDKVVVSSSDFYHGAEGVIVSYEPVEDRYEVQLAFACSRWFFGDNIKKVKKVRSRK